MSIFPFIHFFNMIAYIYLAVYIYIKSPKAMLNRISFYFLLCFALWSFGMVSVHNPEISRETALLWININAVGWIGFPSFFIWFVLEFTRKKEIQKKKWFFPLLFGIPMLMIYKQWTNFLFVDVIKMPYGWKTVFGSTIWPYLFALYIFVYVCTGLYFNLIYIRTTRNLYIKKQARIFFVTVLISLALGALTDIILPLTGYNKIPNMADTTSLIWVFGFVYAVVKYKFLTITPAIAAENIISTMFDCLILLDLQGKIVTVNNAAVNLLGYSEDQLKDKSLWDLYTEEKGMQKQWLSMILQSEKIENRDFIFKTNEGEHIPVLFSCSLLKDSSGAAGGIVCVAKDITERKKLEEETLKSKKLESMGILAGGIAHDFNNILSVIMGNLSLAKESLPPDNNSAKLLDNAQHASEMAAGLASKFITFSKGGWLNKEKVVLSSFINTLKIPGLRLALVRKPQKKAVDQQTKSNTTELNPDQLTHVEVKIPVNLMPISGDRDQLAQVLQNLLINARDAIPENRQADILMDAENIIIVEDSKLPLKKGEYIRIQVSDNGKGIEPQLLSKVFDPYYSTKDLTFQKGMGLGLTVCYSIVKKHDGYIKIDSEPHTGTTVTLYLPAWHVAPII